MLVAFEGIRANGPPPNPPRGAYPSGAFHFHQAGKRFLAEIDLSLGVAS